MKRGIREKENGPSMELQGTSGGRTSLRFKIISLNALGGNVSVV